MKRVLLLFYEIEYEPTIIFDVFNPETVNEEKIKLSLSRQGYENRCNIKELINTGSSGTGGGTFRLDSLEIL